MGFIIKNIRDKYLIEFDNGSFDSWCVYLTRPNKPRYAPKDIEYFTILQEYGKIYGAQKICNDFLKFYNLTNNTVNPDVLNLIDSLSKSYNNDAEEFEIWFTIIYAGMVAEENKSNAKLKKRIKRLGLHQVLIEGIAPEIASNFSKGKEWRSLDILMKSKGF